MRCAKNFVFKCMDYLGQIGSKILLHEKFKLIGSTQTILWYVCEASESVALTVHLLELWLMVEWLISNNGSDRILLKIYHHRIHRFCSIDRLTKNHIVFILFIVCSNKWKCNWFYLYPYTGRTIPISDNLVLNLINKTTSN